jgi:oligopeptide/dipeptide ABC transporter ATP-binding protein
VSATAPQLEISGLSVSYGTPARPMLAVDDVSLTVGRGERVGLVGESGSGKSSVAFAVTRLLRPPGRVVQGQARFAGTDLLQLDDDAMNQLRGSQLGIVYQDPFTFLNPVMRVGEQVTEVLRAHRALAAGQARARAVTLFERLGLRPGALTAGKFPHQLSGGQRQRVVIAMAIVAEPTLVIADEPTTALDVTVQAQILRLLARSVDEIGSSLLLISHDLSVIRLMCQRVYVMYAGQIVESGDTAAIFSSPRHPYTAALVAASARALNDQNRFPTIAGAPPDLRHPPAGCRFAARCAHRMAVCSRPAPLLPTAAGGQAACWLEESGR